MNPTVVNVAEATPAEPHGWLAATKTTWTILAVGLAVRVIAFALLGTRPLADDAVDYHQMALDLVHGVPFSTDWPPGVALWLVPFVAWLGSGPLAAHAAMLPWYAILSAGVFAVAHRTAGTRAANLALMALVIAPAQVLHAVLPLTQLPTAALLVVTLALALRALEAERPVRAAGWFLLLGGTLGAAVLVRPPTMACALALPVALAFRARRRLLALLPFVTLALVVSLWLVEVRGVAGRFVFINDASSQNFFYGNNEWTPWYRTWWFGSHKYPEASVPRAYAEAHAAIGRLPITERDAAFSRAALRHIAARPDLFVVRSLSRIRTFVAFDTYAAAHVTTRIAAPRLLGLGILGLDALHYLVVLLLAAAALCAGGWATASRRERDWLVLALTVLVTYAGPYLVSFSHPTYHFPVVPILAVMAATFVVRRPRIAHPRSLGIVLTVLALVQVEWLVALAGRG